VESTLPGSTWKLAAALSEASIKKKGSEIAKRSMESAAGDLLQGKSDREGRGSTPGNQVVKPEPRAGKGGSYPCRIINHRDKKTNGRGPLERGYTIESRGPPIGGRLKNGRLRRNRKTETDGKGRKVLRSSIQL